jgi:hypothetical protein
VKERCPPGAERDKAKTLLNSLIGCLGKKPMKYVWKKLTPHNLARDLQILDKTFEAQGRYTILNG